MITNGNSKTDLLNMQKYFCIKIVLLGAVGFATRWWGLGEHSFVNNELYIMLHIKYLEQGLSVFFQSFFNWEIHPPLNHLFIFIWGKAFGFTEFSIRSLSAIFSLLSLLLLFEIARLCFNKKTAVLCLTFLIFSFPAISLGRMATSYGWLIFYSTLTTYLFVRIDQSERDRREPTVLLFLFLTALLVASYTHYLCLVFCLILLCMSWHKAFWKQQRLYKILASLIFAVFYAPWVPVIFKQFPRLKTHDYPRILDEHPFFDLFFYFSNKSWPLFILLSIILIKWLFDLVKRRVNKFEILFATLALGPILFFYLLSVLSTEIWNLHYFALTLPFWILIVSASVSRIQIKYLNDLATLFICGLSTVHYLYGHYEKNYPIRIEIRETVASVIDWQKTNNQLGQTPILNHSWSYYIFGHYFERFGQNSLTYLIPEGKLDLMKSRSKIIEVLGNDEDLKHTKFWLLNTYNPLSSDLKSFIEQNYRPTVQFNNKSVSATLYKARNGG